MEADNDARKLLRPNCYAYVLRGRIQPEEWSRVQYYARFVRRCGFDSDVAVIDPSVYACLFRCNNGDPLLPGLQDLDWSQELPNETSLLFFLAPSLRRLAFEVLSRQGRDPALTVMDYALEMLFSKIAVDATYLEELTLVGVRHWQSMTPLVGCKKLKHLNLSDAWPIGESISDVLSILTGLTQLSSLDIQCASSVASRRGVGDPTHFPHLVRLSAGGDDTSVASLLANIVLPQLEELHLDLTFPTSEHDIDRSIREFNLAANTPKLHTLIIMTQTLSDDEHVLPQSLLDIVKPLLGLKQLVIFGFCLTQLQLNVSDDDIRQIAQAWPKLDSLWLDMPLSAVRPSLHALHIIARTCLDLKTLSLPSIFHSNDIPDTTGLHPHGLVRLFVHVQGVDAEELNRYSTSLFPLLQIVVLNRSFPRFPDMQD